MPEPIESPETTVDDMVAYLADDAGEATNAAPDGDGDGDDDGELGDDDGAGEEPAEGEDAKEGEDDEENEENEDGDDDDDDEEKDEDEDKKEEETETEISKSKKRRLAAQAKAREAKAEAETLKTEVQQAKQAEQQSRQQVQKSVELLQRSHATQRGLEAELKVTTEEMEYWKAQATAKGVQEDPWRAEHFATKLENLKLKSSQEARKQSSDVHQQQQVSAAQQQVWSQVQNLAQHYAVEPKHLLLRMKENQEMGFGKTLEQCAQELTQKRRPTKRETRKRKQNTKSKASPVTLETGGGAGTVFEPTEEGMLSYLESTSGG